MIAVVNYGSQFTHLIARRLRQLRVHGEIVPSTVTADELGGLRPSGIILSGGPNSVYDKNAPTLDPAVFDLGVPVLGICYGEQLMVRLLGGGVIKGTSGQYGKETLREVAASPLFAGLPKEHIVWFSHGDQVGKLPVGFKKIAVTDNYEFGGIADESRKRYGIQFHPEVVHTEFGQTVLQNFALTICGDPADWTPGSIRQTLTDDLRERVGDGQVLVAVSGGVDSMVMATLLHEVVPKQLQVVFVDTGLLRKDEAREVTGVFQARGFTHFHAIDAAKTFLKKLKGISDPEQKREIIGHAFIEVFDQTVAKIGKSADIKYLAQGTIYPDRIESAAPGGHAAKIKSHHNLTLPEKMNLEVIEPLGELYKDEVRELGLELGLPEHLIGRHPFPGPGLAIRILGAVDEEKLAILREADAIYTQELRTSGLYDQIWQAFAALFPVKAVGVMGDARTYEYVISLRAVNSLDGMTADWFQFPPDALQRISTRIVNEVKGVNRVVYDVTQKPPGTIEYE